MRIQTDVGGRKGRSVLASVAAAVVFSLPVAAADAEQADTIREPWPVYTDVLAPRIAKVPGVPGGLQDEQLKQELYKFVYMQTAQVYFQLLYQDPEYPDFWPVYNQAFNFGFPNPDDSYYMAVVDGDGTYRISGTRGSVYLLNFQIGTNEIMSKGLGGNSHLQMSKPAADYNFDDEKVKVAEDGTFEILLSAERPAGYTGDWWHLAPNAKFILVRQRSYDWVNEVDGRLAIERMDRPAMKPRIPAATIAKQLAQSSESIENWTNLQLNFGIEMRKHGLINKVDSMGQPGGHVAQKYLLGLFDLKADEALLLDVAIPKPCRYWSYQLTDEIMSAIDPLNRQTNLNGHTARIDSDGHARVVISAQDPGVPNWLDNAGYARGAMVLRWMYCSAQPVPDATLIKVADIRRHIPADTPSVTAEQREQAIRVRRRAAQMRKRW
jgi:Protein of unknown function (DUF1214)